MDERIFMRDKRWLDRFYYAWQDSLFYNTIELYYKPRDEGFSKFISGCDGAKVERWGIWWGVDFREKMPQQGWKIHVSATPENAEQILKIVSIYLSNHRTSFKFVLDERIFEFLNLKTMSRGSSGKFITIYPQSKHKFLEIIKDLAGLLDQFVGPYILSDMRYKDVKCLYFRYGQFSSRHRIDIMGVRQAVMKDPDGNLIDDVRTPYFAIPDWESWPFEDWEAEDVSDNDENILLNGRYSVIEVVSFSNSGGVYVCNDIESDKQVIVKEARPHTGLSPRHQFDSIKLLNREWEFLNILKHTGIVPQPIEIFTDWEHSYLAEELIVGVDIRAILLDKNPLTMLSPNINDSNEYLKIFLKIFKNYAKKLDQIHKMGIILGDINVKNFIIIDDYDVRFIDLESARVVNPNDKRKELGSSIELYTPGFRDTERTLDAQVESDDLYALASIMAYFIFPIAAINYLRKDGFEIYQPIVKDLGWPIVIYEKIKQLASGELTLFELIEFLNLDHELIGNVKKPFNGVQNIDSTILTSPEREHAYLNDDNLNQHRQLNNRANTIRNRLLQFIHNTFDENRSSFFPSDPFEDITNPLSLGFGASGVIRSVMQIEGRIPEIWSNKYLDTIKKIDTANYTTGLLTGLSGIALSCLELGENKIAEELMSTSMSNNSLYSDYSYYYGSSGTGIVNIYFYLRTKNEKYLDNAVQIGQKLIKTASLTRDSAHWLNDISPDQPYQGLGYGQSGVALFMLRLSQITGEKKYKDLSLKALQSDLQYALLTEKGILTFEENKTTSPYVETGVAGVIKVMLRCGLTEHIPKMIGSITHKYYVLPGMLFGMAGIMDTILDCKKYLNNIDFIDIFEYQMKALEDTFLFEPHISANLGIKDRNIAGLAVPGEGLLRVVCDYATGSSGIATVLNRFVNNTGSDLMLDELD